MQRLFLFFRHSFIPHYSNNQRAKLLHHETIFVIALVFLISGFLLGNLKTTHPRVLGSSIDISSQELLLLTNADRQQAGVGPLVLNDQLSNAAAAKANYMFAKDFWAHIAPDGKTPWDFIKAAGYNYVYAGENLARGFSTSSDVVSAWMASPDHRANMLSKNYQDVGFAIQKGELTGESDTILVVEMFGGQLAAPLSNTQGGSPSKQTVLAEGTGQQVQSPLLINQPVINTFTFARNITLFLLSIFIIVFVIDAIIIYKKRIFRIVGHNMDHILFLGGIVFLIMFLARGSIF